MKLSLDATLKLSLDATLKLSLDATLKLSLDATLKLSLDATLKLSLDATLKLSLDVTLKLSSDVTLRLSLDVTLRLSFCLAHAHVQETCASPQMNVHVSKYIACASKEQRTCAVACQACLRSSTRTLANTARMHGHLCLFTYNSTAYLCFQQYCAAMAEIGAYHACRLHGATCIERE